MTTSSGTGTVLITGPTSGLGKALALELANREASERPDLLLVGRPGDRLAEITGAVRAAGAAAEPVPCDLARLAGIRAAAQSVKDLLAACAVAPLRAPIQPGQSHVSAASLVRATMPPFPAVPVGVQGPR